MFEFTSSLMLKIMVKISEYYYLRMIWCFDLLEHDFIC